MIMDKLFMQADRGHLNQFHGIYYNIADRRILVSSPSFEMDGVSACRNASEEIFTIQFIHPLNEQQHRS